MYGYNSCHKTFSVEKGCNAHMDALGHWGTDLESDYECETCDRTFTTENGCNQHMDALGHWAPAYECEGCFKTFYTQYACDQHMNATGHWAEVYECETCDQTFRTLAGSEQHMYALRHWEPKFPCEMCGRKFHTQNAANQHMSDTGHWGPRFPCATCDKMFYSDKSAEQHMEALGHWENYCRDCDRHFDNQNSLRMHLNSKIHRRTTVTCPFCKVNFTSASGVTTHLESGSCAHAAGANRGTIHLMIQERDPNGTVTKKEIDHSDLPIRYAANNRAFNGRRWEFYMCHREFDTVDYLNTLLNSPAHKQNIYHCPNRKCEREFSTLAALFNHLESEACGCMKFEKVQGEVGDVLRGKMITFG